MAAPDPSARNRRLVMLAVAGIAAGLLVLLVYWGATTLLPEARAWVEGAFSPGLGLRTAAIIAAVVAFAVLIVLTLAAGDGLLGEIQFVIPGFFLFFLFFWLMTAWVF
jgi:hypothetical protein